MLLQLLLLPLLRHVQPFLLQGKRLLLQAELIQPQVLMLDHELQLLHLLHQLVLIDGKDPASGPSVIFQMSFYLQSLDDLRHVRDQLVKEGVTDISPICHGNAWSVYASDPEGNGLEAYLDTPWHVAQPHGKPFDLSQPNEIIHAQTEAYVKTDPTFQVRGDWMKHQEKILFN